MSDVKAGEATVSGQGTVKPGGTVSGKGTITRVNGEVVEFELQSEPLTQEQADALNKVED